MALQGCCNWPQHVRACLTHQPCNALGAASPASSGTCAGWCGGVLLPFTRTNASACIWHPLRWYVHHVCSMTCLHWSASRWCALVCVHAWLAAGGAARHADSAGGPHLCQAGHCGGPAAPGDVSVSVRGSSSSSSMGMGMFRRACAPHRKLCAPRMRPAAWSGAGN